MPGKRKSQSINHDSSGDQHSADTASARPAAFENTLHAFIQDITSIVETIPPPSTDECPAGDEEHLQMYLMLEHLKMKCKWEKVIENLQSAIDAAQSKKKQHHQRAKACQDDLQDIRRKRDNA